MARNRPPRRSFNRPGNPRDPTCFVIADRATLAAYREHFSADARVVAFFPMRHRVFDQEAAPPMPYRPQSAGSARIDRFEWTAAWEAIVVEEPELPSYHRICALEWRGAEGAGDD